MKLKDLNFTHAPWYSVEYAGYWELQNGPHYGDPSLLDYVKYENAEDNALLSSRAPEMLEKLKKAEECLKWIVFNALPLTDRADPNHKESVNEVKTLLKEITDLLNS